jgi:hypothetical protein
VFIEKVIGDLGDKRRWRQYKARTRQLPGAEGEETGTSEGGDR